MSERRHKLLYINGEADRARQTITEICSQAPLPLLLLLLLPLRNPQAQKPKLIRILCKDHGSLSNYYQNNFSDQKIVNQVTQINNSSLLTYIQILNLFSLNLLLGSIRVCVKLAFIRNKEVIMAHQVSYQKLQWESQQLPCKIWLLPSLLMSPYNGHEDQNHHQVTTPRIIIKDIISFWQHRDREWQAD